MASLSAKIVVLLIIIAFPFGQLLRISLFGHNFPLIDPLLSFLAAVNFLVFLTSAKKKIKNKFFLFFLVAAIVSYLLNGFRYSYSLSSIFHLIRLVSFISFFIIPPPSNLIDKKTEYLFSISVITSLIVGFIQYFLWPDFTYFDALNWDPHLYRLVGSFFDPTFTALIFLIFLISSYFQKDQVLRYFLLPLTYIALVLTYSRSTYLSLFASSLFVGYSKKKWQTPLFVLLLIAGTVFLLPRQPGEGTKLERTSSIKAKLVNYKNGFDLYRKSPIIGYGYNNLSRVRTDVPPSSHAANGFDSSLLTILATTGVFGFIFFILGIRKLITYSTIEQKTILTAVFVHSLFANSLFYPWIIFYLLVLYSKNRT